MNTAVCHLKQYIIFFIECEIVKRFWNDLRIWLSNNSTIRIELREKQILFACQDKRNTLRNYMCFIAKYYIYIYVTKFTRNRLLLEDFINLLKKKFQNEKILHSRVTLLQVSLLNGHLYIIILMLMRGSKFIHVYELLYFEQN